MRSTPSGRRTSSRTTASRPARASSSPRTAPSPSPTPKACGRVVIEEYLDGPEVSLFAVTDGVTVVPLQPAQDFKRLGDGDAGPNTGGMGAYSPLPWAPADLVDDVLARVLQPTVDEMRHRGCPRSPGCSTPASRSPRTARGSSSSTPASATPRPRSCSLACAPRSPGCSSRRRPAASTSTRRWCGTTSAPSPSCVASEGYPDAPVTGDPIAGAERRRGAPRGYVARR